MALRVPEGSCVSRRVYTTVSPTPGRPLFHCMLRSHQAWIDGYTHVYMGCNDANGHQYDCNTHIWSIESLNSDLVQSNSNRVLENRAIAELLCSYHTEMPLHVQEEDCRLPVHVQLPTFGVYFGVRGRPAVFFTLTIDMHTCAANTCLSSARGALQVELPTTIRSL